jgi:hypothetical protein
MGREAGIARSNVFLPESALIASGTLHRWSLRTQISMRSGVFCSRFEESGWRRILLIGFQSDEMTCQLCQSAFVQD